MRPYGSVWVFLVFMRLMDSNGSLWVLIGPYVLLLVRMSLYRSSCVFMDCNRALWVLAVLFASLRILMGIYASF